MSNRRNLFRAGIADVYYRFVRKPAPEWLKRESYKNTHTRLLRNVGVLVFCMGNGMALDAIKVMYVLLFCTVLLF